MASVEVRSVFDFSLAASHSQQPISYSSFSRISIYSYCTSPSRFNSFHYISAMETCTFSGNPDMYGLGIRIGYYLQWYGGILAAWIAPEESSSLRLANALFVAATFLALFIQTIQEHAEKSFPIVETYIILFLAFGSYLVLVPIYLWRIFTCCNPYLDPTRFPRVNPGRVYGYMNSVLLTAVLGFELWYWIHQVPKLATVKCAQYGFFFHKIQLNNRGFRMLNVIPCLFLLLCCITLVCMKVVSKVRPSQGEKVVLKREQYKPLDQDLYVHKCQPLQLLVSFTNPGPKGLSAHTSCKSLTLPANLSSPQPSSPVSS